MASEAPTTTDHDTIRQWAEARGGKPVGVKGTGGNGDPGIIQIEFPSYGTEDDKLEEITWDEFFDKFEESSLAFLYQEEKADGEPSTFCKLVKR